MISQEHPFLEASPDAVIHDPTSDNPFGLAEVKSPYSKRHITPVEAARVTDFCSTLEIDSDGQEYLQLKRTSVLLSGSRTNGYHRKEVV